MSIALWFCKRCRTATLLEKARSSECCIDPMPSYCPLRKGLPRKPWFSAIAARSITCPRCGLTSYNLNDVRAGYCDNCHDWTTPR